MNIGINDLINAAVSSLKPSLVPEAAPSPSPSLIEQAGRDIWMPAKEGARHLVDVVKNLSNQPGVKIGAGGFLGTVGSVFAAESLGAIGAMGAAAVGVAAGAVLLAGGLGYHVGIELDQLCEKATGRALSETLAADWDAAMRGPSFTRPNENGQWTGGWHFLPDEKIDAPSGAPADPLRSPGKEGPAVSAPPAFTGVEMEMRSKKTATIGDPITSHETLRVSSGSFGRDPIRQEMIEAIRKNPFKNQAAWGVLADYLMEHGEAEQGELILLEQKIRSGNFASGERPSLEGRRDSIRANLTKNLWDELTLATSSVLRGPYASATGIVNDNVVLTQLVQRYPLFLSQSARESLFDGRPIGTDRFNSRYGNSVLTFAARIAQKFRSQTSEETSQHELERLWSDQGFVTIDGVPDSFLRERLNDLIASHAQRPDSPFSGQEEFFRTDSAKPLDVIVFESEMTLLRGVFF
ncbi:MAG TPA: hypothetical protein VFX30_13780 [bacterium]|nr:hypothetical protein [bacterium]